MALREAAALSDDPDLCGSAGRLLLRQGELEASAEALRRAVTLGATEREVLLDLARALLATDKSLAAVELLRPEVQRSPDDPEAAFLFATALDACGSSTEAATHLERSIHQSSSYVPGLRLLGHLRMRNRQGRAAIELFRRVLALTAGEEVADLVALGTALSDGGEHDEAIRVLSEANRKSPGSAETLANLGTAHLAIGATAAAVENLTEAVRLEPDGAHARCMLGVALHHGGRSKEALDHLRRACELAPSWPAAHFNMGKLLCSLGDIKAARDALTTAQQLSPADGDIRAALEQLSKSEEEEETSGATSPKDANGSITGDLGTFRLPDLLEFLRMQRSTGTLVLSSRRGAGLIRLSEGQLTGASAPATPRLGQLLVQQGAIDERLLREIVEQQRLTEKLQEEPALLGMLLVKKKLVGLERLNEAMTEQLLSALAELMEWKTGQFAFHASSTPAPSSLSFDIQPLLMEATRRADEARRDGRAFA